METQVVLLWFKLTLEFLGGGDNGGSGDIAWLVTASALIWLMLPGVGFFYSGLTGHKSALSLIMLSFIAMSVATLQVHPLKRGTQTVVFMGLLAHFLFHRE